MGVGRVGVAIVMGMIVAMFMVVMMRVVHDLERALGVDAFHMVVVAFLHGAHIGLEAQHGVRYLHIWQFMAMSPVRICWMRSTKVSITAGWSLR